MQSDELAPNPREVITNMLDGYWHQVRQAAVRLGLKPQREELFAACGLIVGKTSGNYADVLDQCRGHMPTTQAEIYLAQLSRYFRSLDIIGPDLEGSTKLVDQAYECYSRLVQILGAENPE